VVSLALHRRCLGGTSTLMELECAFTPGRSSSCHTAPKHWNRTLTERTGLTEFPICSFNFCHNDRKGLHMHAEGMQGIVLSVISGFRCDVEEICALLGYNAALNGSSVATFRDNLSVLFSRAKKVQEESVQHRPFCFCNITFSTLFLSTRRFSDRSVAFDFSN
jgi:hypothetical protein